jgi:hypothetical protein
MADGSRPCDASRPTQRCQAHSAQARRHPRPQPAGRTAPHTASWSQACWGAPACAPAGVRSRRGGSRPWQWQSEWRALAHAGPQGPAWGQRRVPGPGSQGAAGSGAAASCALACATSAALQGGGRRGPMVAGVPSPGGPRARHAEPWCRVSRPLLRSPAHGGIRRPGWYPRRWPRGGHWAGKASASVTQPPNTALEATGHSVHHVAGVGLYGVARASDWALGSVVC